LTFKATFLSKCGVSTYIDDKHAIAHNKIMIIDRGTVITASFNFTKAAEERNAENLLIISKSWLRSIWRTGGGIRTIWRCIGSNRSFCLEYE
jgi:phosphatidylserine/phosphatidylglycerophosphate/cardiolipin synthase-like enzyme